MFIEQAFRTRHEFWRYIVGILVIIAFSVLGQLPLGLVLILKNSDAAQTVGQDAMKNLMEASHLSSNMFTFLMLLSFVFTLFGIFIAVKYLHGQSLTSLTTGRQKIDWKRFFLSFSIVAVVTIVSTAFDYFNNPENYELNFQLVPFLILLVMSLVLIPIQTSTEEYLFRGYLMQGLGTLTKTRWIPLILTSIIFGALHFSNPEVSQFGNILMVYYIGTGLFLGIITLMDDGLELSLGFHVANNLIGILLVTADWSAFQSESVLRDTSNPDGAGMETFFPLLVVYPILLILFSKIYHWKNWKKRLLGRVEPPKDSNSKLR